MSFVVDKVVVSNFRTHKFFSFEPSDSGVTVIKGANGTGKSSLVDSIAWCLFGIKPQGVGKNGDLRRKDMGEKDKTFVEVTIKTIEGVVYKVQRRIVGKKGSTECDVWIVANSEDENGNEIEVLDHVSGASVSHSDEFLRAHLGVTEKSFRASMFVQQKQVDDLLTASPKERSVVIEKMTGITALTEATTDIRAEVNDAKKTVEVLSKNTEDYDVDGLKETLEEFISLKEKTSEELAEKINEGKELKAKLEKETDNHKAISDLITKLEKTKNDKVNLTNQIDFVSSSISDLHSDIDNKNVDLSSLNEGNENKESSDEIRANYNALGNKVRENDKNIDRITNDISNVRKSMAGYLPYKNILDSLGIVFTKDNFNEEVVSNALETIREKLNESLEATTSLSKEFESCENARMNAKFNFETNTQTLKALDNENGECPTCHQAPENASELLDNIRNVVEINKKDLVLHTEKAKELSEELKSNQQNIDNYNNTINALEETLKNIPLLQSLRKELSDLESSSEKNKKQFELAQIAHDNIRRVEMLEQAIKSDYAKIENYKGQISKYKNNIEELNIEESSLSENIALYPEISSVENLINELNEQLDVLRNEVFAKKEQNSNLDLKIDYTQRDLNKAIAGADEYKKAVDKLEKLTAASSVVSSFREKRIEEVIPEISFIASDLLQRFTDGKFVGMQLDSSYKAKVQLPNGELRDTGLLSGGELSAVALALRLAIALLSYGESTGISTMILDEVLVSQDEDRVESIITTMKEVLQGQVILIGHNGDVISSIADNIVELSHNK